MHCTSFYVGIVAITLLIKVEDNIIGQSFRWKQSFQAKASESHIINNGLDHEIIITETCSELFSPE